MLLTELNTTSITYRPTQHERMVIAKVLISQTPQVAFDQVSRGVHLNAAKMGLAKLGFISIMDGKIELTDKGNELAKAQALADDMMEPTDQARELSSI